MKNQSLNEASKGEYPCWGRVYVIVVIYTAGLIVGLWFFSQLFEP